MNQSVNKSVSQPLSFTDSHVFSQSVIQSINQSVTQLVNQSCIQLVSNTGNQPVSKEASEPVSSSASLLHGSDKVETEARTAAGDHLDTRLNNAISLSIYIQVTPQTGHTCRA